MNHIHIKIKPGAIATFSQDPTKETLEAVKKLIEAAEKKLNEPEERYFKCRTNNYVVCYHGIIYNEKHLLEGGITNIKAYEFEQVTKQDYLNQELLEEAKIRYQIGTCVKSLGFSAITVIGRIQDHINASILGNEIIFKDDCGGSMVVYKNGKWAEIIIEDKNPLFEFEDFKKDLNNLLEKYSCNVK